MPDICVIWLISVEKLSPSVLELLVASEKKKHFLSLLHDQAEAAAADASSSAGAGARVPSGPNSADDEMYQLFNQAAPENLISRMNKLLHACLTRDSWESTQPDIDNAKTQAIRYKTMHYASFESESQYVEPTKISNISDIFA